MSLLDCTDAEAFLLLKAVTHNRIPNASYQWASTPRRESSSDGKPIGGVVISRGIYQIKNQVDGKRYIGSAINIQQRWTHHLGRLRRGQHPNHHVQTAFNKYGEPAFVLSILEHVDDPAQLIPREQHYLDALNPKYNILRIAGSCLGFHHSMETRRKMSANKTGGQNPFYGKRHSEEARRKPSKARRKQPPPFRGKHHRAETKQKISEATSGERHYNFGRHLSEETRQKIRAAGKGRIHSKETRAKISEVLKGRRFSEEHCRKISEARQAYWRQIRTIENRETGE